MMKCVQPWNDWGVPPPQMQAGSRFPLQVLAAFPRLQAWAQAAVGFPLQSLTRTVSYKMLLSTSWNLRNESTCVTNSTTKVALVVAIIVQE